jgi:hypothetical protein
MQTLNTEVFNRLIRLYQWHYLTSFPNGFHTWLHILDLFLDVPLNMRYAMLDNEIQQQQQHQMGIKNNYRE